MRPSWRSPSRKPSKIDIGEPPGYRSVASMMVQHLVVPIVRAQRSAMMEHDRLGVSRSPVLVEYPGAVLHRKHGLVFLMVDGGANAGRRIAIADTATVGSPDGGCVAFWGTSHVNRRVANLGIQLLARTTRGAALTEAAADPTPGRSRGDHAAEPVGWSRAHDAVAPVLGALARRCVADVPTEPATDHPTSKRWFRDDALSSARSRPLGGAGTRAISLLGASGCRPGRWSKAARTCERAVPPGLSRANAPS